MTDAERIETLRRALSSAGREITGLQDGDYMAHPPMWIQEVLAETAGASEVSE